MQSITTISLDIAKSVFQIHGVDVTGWAVIRRHLKRRYVLAFFEKLPPCLVGIEACAFDVMKYNAALVTKVLANSAPSTHDP
jgi:transposase